MKKQHSWRHTRTDTYVYMYVYMYNYIYVDIWLLFEGCVYVKLIQFPFTMVRKDTCFLKKCLHYYPTTICNVCNKMCHLHERRHCIKLWHTFFNEHYTPSKRVLRASRDFIFRYCSIVLWKKPSDNTILFQKSSVHYKAYLSLREELETLSFFASI